jgi:hypothetical protein
MLFSIIAPFSLTGATLPPSAIPQSLYFVPMPSREKAGGLSAR